MREMTEHQPVKFYQCEHCGKRSRNKSHIEDCEKRHRRKSCQHPVHAHKFKAEDYCGTLEINRECGLCGQSLGSKVVDSAELDQPKCAVLWDLMSK